MKYKVIRSINIANRFFSKSIIMAIMPTLASYSLPHENKNFSDEMLLPMRIECRPLINLWFKVQQSLFWTNSVFACKTENLGSLYSHALMNLTKSSKSKNQAAHEQKFKDFPSSTCQVSPERRVIKRRGEDRVLSSLGVTFCHWIFCFDIVKLLMPILDYCQLC